jgi:branched-chain amino acid transport system substrate-binding protein
LRCKRILAFTPVLSMLLVAGCTSATGGSADKADIVIAASLEQSGAQADVGKVYENALRLKVEQINAGRAANARKVTLRIGDNHSDVAASRALISEYAADPTVSAIITGWSSECLIDAVKTINDKGVPTIALAPSTQVSTPVLDRRYIFKLGPNINHDAAALIGDLNRPGSGVKSIRLLASTDAYGHDGAEVMSQEATKAGLIVGPVSQLTGGDENYTQAAKAVSLAKPDAVIVLAFPTVANAVVSALHTAGYKGKIALDASAAGALFLTGPALAQEGATLVYAQTLAIDDVIATTPANAARRQWFQDYTARYGSYQAPASFAADAAQLIVDAVDKIGSATDHNGIRSALETTRTDGLSGPIRITPNDHSGLMPQSLALLVARNGRWRLS